MHINKTNLLVIFETFPICIL